MADTSDYTNPMKSGSFYHVIVLLIPGSISLVTPILILHRFHHNAFIFNKDSETTLIFIFLVLALSLGMIFEEIGANLEDNIDEYFEKRDKDKNSRHIAEGNPGLTKATHLEIWEKYLETHFEKEPIGQEFIRSILVRLKFSLSMLVSLFICLLSTPFLWIHNIGNFISLFVGVSAILAAMVVFVHSAFKNANTLSEVRRRIVK
jgi:hypothetical protein